MISEELMSKVWEAYQGDPMDSKNNTEAGLRRVVEVVIKHASTPSPSTHVLASRHNDEIGECEPIELEPVKITQLREKIALSKSGDLLSELEERIEKNVHLIVSRMTPDMRERYRQALGPSPQTNMAADRISRVRVLLKNLEAKSTEDHARILSEAEQLIYDLTRSQQTSLPAVSADAMIDAFYRAMDDATTATNPDPRKVWESVMPAAPFLREHLEGWQPIDTAEKYHGNSVIGWVKVCGMMCVQTVFYSEFGRNWRRKLDGNIVEDITHWMPYPAPPSETPALQTNTRGGE